MATHSQAATEYATLSPTTQHHVVHAIVDAIIDALTFGCPATMRVLPHALQWRKFDEQPIATLTIHPRQQPRDTALHQQLSHDCGDPVLMVRHAWDDTSWNSTTIATQFATCSATPVTSVAWRQHDGCWVLTINQTAIGVIPGTLSPPPNQVQHVLSARPHQQLSPAQITAALTFLHEVTHDVSRD